MSNNKLESYADDNTRNQILNEVKKKSNYCFDCNKPAPKWACSLSGILLCINCAGKHRNMGTHISFIRSVDFDRWKYKQLWTMQLGGNPNLAKYMGSSQVDYVNDIRFKQYKEHLVNLVSDYASKNSQSQSQSLNNGSFKQNDLGSVLNLDTVDDEFDLSHGLGAELLEDEQMKNEVLGKIKENKKKSDEKKFSNEKMNEKNNLKTNNRVLEKDLDLNLVNPNQDNQENSKNEIEENKLEYQENAQIADSVVNTKNTNLVINTNKTKTNPFAKKNRKVIKFDDIKVTSISPNTNLNSTNEMVETPTPSVNPSTTTITNSKYNQLQIEQNHQDINKINQNHLNNLNSMYENQSDSNNLGQLRDNINNQNTSQINMITSNFDKEVSLNPNNTHNSADEVNKNLERYKESTGIGSDMLFSRNVQNADSSNRLAKLGNAKGIDSSMLNGDYDSQNKNDQETEVSDAIIHGYRKVKNKAWDFISKTLNK